MNSRVSQIAIAFVIAVGVLALFGWQFDIELLKTGLPGNPTTMKANTAFCFVLSGISLALSQKERLPRRGYRLALGLAGLVVAVGGLTLLEYIFYWNLGIDELLFHDTAARSTSIYPGRMSESTAFNFVLAGTALLSAGENTHRSQWRAQIFSLLMMFTASMPLMGYFFGGNFFYQLVIPASTTVAWHTAVTFVVLGIGILLSRPQLGLMKTATSPLVGGVLARKLLPWAIALPLMLNWAIFEGYKLGWYDEPSSYAILTVTNITIFSILIYLNACSLNGIEQKRLAVQQQFSRVILDAPLPMMIHAEDGEVLQLSKGWTEITGYRAEEIPTVADWLSRAYGERSSEVQEGVNKLYDLDRRVDENDFTIRTKTGETRIWNFHSAPLGRTADGRRFVVSTALDVTERKHAEDALKELNKTLESRVAQRTAELGAAYAQMKAELQERQRAEQAARDSQALLNSIIESTTDQILAVDTEYRYIAFNQANREEMEKIFGVRIEIGSSLLEILEHIPEEKARVIELWDRTLSGEQFSVTEEFGDPSRERNCYQLTYNPIRDDSGQVIGASLFSKDVSDRIRKERALRESEARFQAFMNYSPVIAWITTSEGEIVYCNQNCEPVFGHPVEELIGKTPFDLHPCELAEQHLENIRFASESEGAIETVESAFRPDGSPVEFLVYKFPLPGEGGERLVGGVGLDISARKKAEQAVRESEAKLQAILDNAPACIYLKDREGRHLFLNQYSLKAFNWTLEQSIGKANAELFPPEIAEGIEANDRAVWESGAPVYVEEKVLQSDGIHVNYSAKFLLYDLAGNPYALCGISTDISDRKRAEAALQQSEARYLAIIEDQTELISRYRPDGTPLFVNESYCRFFGIKREDIIGRTYAPIIFEEDRDRVNELVATISWENSVVVIENRVIAKEGVRWTQWINRGIFDENHCLLECQAVGRDITDRKRVEDALKESQERLQLALEASGDGLWDWNMETGEVYYSPRYMQMLGYEPNELPFDVSTWEYLAHPDDMVWVKNILEAHCKDSSFPYAFDYRVRNKSGEWQWVADYGKVVARDKHGKPLRMIGTHRDIGDRKQTEAILLEAKEAAESASRAKSAFLASMSHELRTPLNAILGFTQVLERDSSLTQKQQEQIAIINNSGEHLLSLINDILEISKIEAGRLTLNPNSFDIYALIEGIETMLQSKAEAKGLQVLCECDVSVPHYLTGDEGKVRQVLSNLLDNAIKFTSTGGVSLRVRADENARDANLEEEFFLFFEVSDTGSGIVAEELDKLFAPFVQAETGKKYREGTGLGLAISRKLVELMGGDIAISSRLGEGTTVKFHIRAAAAKETDVQTRQEKRRIVGLEPGQPIYRILVVDDRPESRLLLRHFLEPLGFDVREAENGREAIAVWEEWHPHLIWMDMRMPMMDGYEATKQIKSHLQGQATVIIALTASAFEENRSIILSTGCDDFVRKPCREEVLLQKIAQHLGARFAYEEKPTAESLGDSLGAAIVSRDRASAKLHRQGREPQAFITDAAALQVMPREWIAALHQAASSADDTAILELLDRVPENYSHLADTLREWVDNFCFEKIICLTEESDRD